MENKQNTTTEEIETQPPISTETEVDVIPTNPEDAERSEVISTTQSVLSELIGGNLYDVLQKGADPSIIADLLEASDMQRNQNWLRLLEKGVNPTIILSKLDSAAIETAFNNFVGTVDAHVILNALDWNAAIERLTPRFLDEGISEDEIQARLAQLSS
jgi:hypothetical protein